jgi:small subunit ribosomal protein S21
MHAGRQFFNGEANPVVAYALVHFECRRKAAGEPESLVGAIGNDFFNGSGSFDDAGKHKGKVNHFLFSILRLIFAILKLPEEVSNTMLIIDSKDCENIDKALKKYKKKFEKSKVLLQLRARQSFTKPSVKRRGEVLKAIYKQKLATGEIES